MSKRKRQRRIIQQPTAAALYAAMAEGQELPRRQRALMLQPGEWWTRKAIQKRSAHLPTDNNFREDEGNE